MTAAPPDVLRIDEKHLRECCVPNVCSVIITATTRPTASSCPPTIARHYVAWSELTRRDGDFEAEYWTKLLPLA